MFSFLILACMGDPVVTTPPPADAPVAAEPTKVERATAIAAAIRKDPSRADAILAEHATTRADFEALLYEIAEDPSPAAAYAAAQ
jgi:hypothetical protein